MVNYSLKLGWKPLLTDIDLSKNKISAPGCMSAALIEEVLDSQTDNLTYKAITYFHGGSPDNLIITPDLFNTQVNQLANACDLKIQNDLNQFKEENQVEDSEQFSTQQQMQNDLISPVFPQMYASGIFIDSFSPKDEMQTNCMVNAIKAFKCNIVIVVDDKRLELSIKDKLKSSDSETLVLFI